MKGTEAQKLRPALVKETTSPMTSTMFYTVLISAISSLSTINSASILP